MNLQQTIINGIKILLPIKGYIVTIIIIFVGLNGLFSGNIVRVIKSGRMR